MHALTLPSERGAPGMSGAAGVAAAAPRQVARATIAIAFALVPLLSACIADVCCRARALLA